MKKAEKAAAFQAERVSPETVEVDRDDRDGVVAVGENLHSALELLDM